MAHSTDVVGYVYRADFYCPDDTLELMLKREGLEGHGLSLNPNQAIERLIISAIGGNKYDDGEHNWDSDDFPKIVFRDMLEGDEHCGKCHCKLGD